MAALIRRCSELGNGQELTVWGSGTPLRQFCYAPDLASLLLWVVLDTGVKVVEPLPLMSETEHTIAELA